MEKQAQDSNLIGQFLKIFYSDTAGPNRPKLGRKRFLPRFGSFGHVVSEEKIFRNRPIRNKNHLWRPCLLMELERNEYSL
jgi:hypothetical protein